MGPYEYYRSTATFASRFFDTVGDGSGSIQMNVDGSVTPKEFKITAPENIVLLIDRLIVHIEDAGSPDSGAYGNSITMTNGIVGFTRKANGDEIYQTGFDQHPIKTNSDWSAFAGPDVNAITFGQGNGVVVVRYSFWKEGAPLILQPGDTAVTLIRDDLTDLVSHHFRFGMSAHALI